MIINHNLPSMNTDRQLGINNFNTAKSLEKLSSGLRINRAGDDAAGLAISEKMRAQVRGLDQASRNSQDGISLIQTGEGALNETHSILQRMRELAVQSSTDTNTSDDRTKIQSEVDQLAKEITRISNTTEFNTKNLLAGGLSTTFHVGANADQNMSLSILAMDAKSLGVAGDIVTTTFTGTNTHVASVSTSSESVTGLYVTANRTAATTGASITYGDTNSGTGTVTGTYTGSANETIQARVASISDTNGTVGSMEYTIDGGSSWKVATINAGNFEVDGGLTLAVAADTDNSVGDTFTFTPTADYVTVGLNSAANGTGTAYGATTKVYNNQSSVSVGNAATDQTATLSFNYSSLVTLAAGSTVGDAITQTKQLSSAAVTGANGTVSTNADTKKGLNVSTQTSANLAITTIDTAIKTVSTERSKLGAMQNRLEHTIANLGTSSENLSAAESRVRDVDMAKEMMQFQKNNILSQAATAMLAQANQQPQGVLQLLR